MFCRSQSAAKFTTIFCVEIGIFRREFLVSKREKIDGFFGGVKVYKKLFFLLDKIQKIKTYFNKKVFKYKRFQ